MHCSQIKKGMGLQLHSSLIILAFLQPHNQCKFHITAHTSPVNQICGSFFRVCDDLDLPIHTDYPGCKPKAQKTAQNVPWISVKK